MATPLEQSIPAANIKKRIENLTKEIATFDEHRADEFAMSKWKELREAVAFAKEMGIDVSELFGASKTRFGSVHTIGTT